jgi:hypothetical protein
MKLSDIFFVAGIAIAVIGAGTGLFPVIGVGVIVFLIGVGARTVERATGGQAHEVDDERDSER